MCSELSVAVNANNVRLFAKATLNFKVAWAGHPVIVDYACRLHEGVANCRSDKFEPARNNAWLITSDCVVLAGTSARETRLFCNGTSSPNAHKKSLNDTPLAVSAK